MTVEREPAAMSVRGAAVWAMGAQYVGFAMQFATSVVISRFFLNPAEVGLFSIALAAALLVAVLQDFGLSRYIAGLPVIDGAEVERCSTVALLFSLVVAGIIAAAAWPMAALYDQPALAPILLIIAGSYLALPLAVVPMAMMARAMQFRGHAIVTVGGTVAQCGVGIALAWAGWSSFALAWATLAAGLARGGIAQALRPSPPWPLRFDSVRAVLSFGSRSSVLYLTGGLGTRTPDLIVGKLLSLTAVGLYSRAVGLSDQFRQLIAGAMGSVFYPAFARIRDRGEPLGPSYLRVCAGYSAIIWPGMAGLALAAEPLVRILYGPEWMGVAPLLTMIAADRDPADRPAPGQRAADRAGPAEHAARLQHRRHRAVDHAAGARLPVGGGGRGGVAAGVRRAVAGPVLALLPPAGAVRRARVGAHLRAQCGGDGRGGGSAGDHLSGVGWSGAARPWAAAAGRGAGRPRLAGDAGGAASSGGGRDHLGGQAAADRAPPLATGAVSRDAPVRLSPVVLPEDSALLRDSPRPPELRDARYADQFDWRTVFYDVFRVGREIVFQGPPLLNLEPALLRDAWFEPRLSGWFPAGRITHRHRCDEVRVRGREDALTLDGALGRHRVTVQPDESHRFAGRRVLHTLSKDNDIRWIAEWTRFHASEHGADGLLLYDNASTAYDLGELRARLVEACPDVAVTVVGWPFPYGPQGGLAGAVGGRETPWDSDFCQTGSLQHARVRFLSAARSVLNADVDELVVSAIGESIFAATERARGGFLKFEGCWISTASPSPRPGGDCGPGDFLYRDARETETCPPKWCLVPDERRQRRTTWSVHNLFGSPHNRRLTDRFAYRHLRGLSNDWKYQRSTPLAWDPERFVRDDDLAAALARADLLPDRQPAM